MLITESISTYSVWWTALSSRIHGNKAVRLRLIAQSAHNLCSCHLPMFCRSFGLFEYLMILFVFNKYLIA